MWWIPRLSRITRLGIPLLLLREALCRVASAWKWDTVLLDYQDAMIPTLGKVGMESFISDALE